MEIKVLQFRWIISKARDTYGYNICSLYVDGEKVSSCNGGGYDMAGTTLGDYLTKTYQQRLKMLYVENRFLGVNKKNYHGMFKDETTDSIYLDGGCGITQIKNIAEDIGLSIERKDWHQHIYIMSDTWHEI